MTVRMELAAALHHSSFRGAGPETHDAPRSQKTVNSREEAVFFELYDEDTAGWRPTPLPEVAGPQAQVLQRTVEPIVDAVSLVPLLDDPVPHTVEQLQDVLKFFDALLPDPDQVIAVPKLYTEDVPMRAVLRATQLAEQLVEVPTIISYPMIALLHALLAQRTVEQNVDIPAVGGGGTVGFPGFLPGQNYSMTAEQIVDNPVPRRGFDEGHQGFPPGQSTAASSEQTVDIPVPHGGRHDLSPSSADFSKPPDTANQGFFRTFPRLKKSAKVTSHSNQRVLRSASSSELSAHQMARAARPQDFSDDGNIFREDEEKIWIRLDTGQWKLLLTLWLTSLGHDSGSASDSVPLRWHGGFWAWRLVRQWIHGLRQFLGAYFEIGRFVMSPMYLALPVRCLVGAMLGSTVDTCSAYPGWLLEEFLTFLVTGWTRILRSILVVSLPANMAEEVAALVVPWHAFCWFFWYFCTSRCVHDVAGMTACTR